jgi:hypothetical protein
MSEFKLYQRRGTIEARPYVPGEPINRADLSISVEDMRRPTLAGGMICRNPDNPEDQWYINPEYFAKHYEATMNEQEIEKEIQDKKLTAPRVTPADLENVIASEHYFTALDGAMHTENAGIQHAEALGLLTFCVLVLKNGFTVTGESACASPENFNAELGRKVAREHAKQKLWPLLGYALKDRLHAIASSRVSLPAHRREHETQAKPPYVVGS